MTKNKKPSTRSKESHPGQAPSWNSTLSAGALVAAVAGTLILGAALQREPAIDASIELPEPTYIEIGETELGIVEPVDPPDRGLPLAAPQESSPARRAALDLERLHRPGGAWTLQFASMCDPQRVRSLVQDLEPREEFYLVPVGDCFKIWWGRYASRESALSRQALPPALSAFPEAPFPRRIAEALP